jgi:hypothetical protein
MIRHWRILAFDKNRNLFNGFFIKSFGCMTYLNTCLLLFCLNFFVEFKRLLLQPYLADLNIAAYGLVLDFLRVCYEVLVFILTIFFNDLHFYLLCFKDLSLEFLFWIWKNGLFLKKKFEERASLEATHNVVFHSCCFNASSHFYFFTFCFSL